MRKQKLKTLLLSSLLLLSLSDRSLAVTTYAVNVKSSSGDYTSISAAESALDVDCTDAIVSSFDASSGTIADGAACSTDSGGTTGTCVHQSINGQILIIGASGGTFDDNDVVTDGTNTVTLSTTADNATIEVTVYNNNSGLAFDGGTYDSTNYIVYQGDTTNWDGKGGGVQLSGTTYTKDPYMYIKNFVLTAGSTSIALRHGETANAFGINLIAINGGRFAGYSNSGANYYINCVSIDSDTNGFETHTSASTNINCYNCVSVNAGQYGFVAFDRNNGYIKCYNCVAVGSGTADFANLYSSTILTGNYGASSDETADDFFANYINSLVAADAFVDAANDDVHLKLGSDLIDAGYDYSATTGANYDIDNVARSGTWDIGADEYVAAGGAARRMIMIQ